jgi:hypothetical protein
MLYVVEMDEESWLAMELGQGKGGTVNACNSHTWVCRQVATNLPMLSSAVPDRRGVLHIVTGAVDPSTVSISTLP